MSAKVAFKRSGARDLSGGDDGGGADPGDVLDGVVDSIVAIHAFSQDPSIRNAGAGLASIGGLVMMGPPPACTAIGAVLTITGTLMSIFDPSETPEQKAAKKEQAY